MYKTQLQSVKIIFNWLHTWKSANVHNNKEYQPTNDQSPMNAVSINPDE